jgi:multiple sugar transport system substrate-binding protein
MKSRFWFVLLGLLLPVLAFAAPVTINFVVWNYNIATIEDNIDKFMATNPDIRVKLASYPWTQYHDTMVLRLKGKTQTDVMYNGEDWLPEFAAAGWVAPLEDYFPQVAAYKAKTAPYALADMTYNGKLYGLSYYADLITFQYNKEILKKNGLSVPRDWDQVLQECLKLKQGGMKNPIIYEYDANLPNFYSAFASQVYGRGGSMFDSKLNPMFDDPNSEAFKHLQWLQDAKVKHDIIAFDQHETKVVVSFNTGQHVFSVMYNYMLAALNKPPQPLAGQFTMAPMPGKAGACLGFAKFYCMTAQASRNPARRNASWKFIEAFGGGDYKVARLDRHGCLQGPGQARPQRRQPRVEGHVERVLPAADGQGLRRWRHRQGSDGPGRRQVEGVPGTARSVNRTLSPATDSRERSRESGFSSLRFFAAAPEGGGSRGEA